MAKPHQLWAPRLFYDKPEYYIIATDSDPTVSHPESTKSSDLGTSYFRALLLLIRLEHHILLSFYRQLEMGHFSLFFFILFVASTILPSGLAHRRGPRKHGGTHSFSSLSCPPLTLTSPLPVSMRYTSTSTLTPTPFPTPSPTQPPSNSSSATSSDIQAFLDGHNTFRAKHGAAPLTWNGLMASKAKQWASRCQFEHSGGQLGEYGGSH
jgi:hypothetical protein